VNTGGGAFTQRSDIRVACNDLLSQTAAKSGKSNLRGEVLSMNLHHPKTNSSVAKNNVMLAAESKAFITKTATYKVSFSFGFPSTDPLDTCTQARTDAFRSALTKEVFKGTASAPGGTSTVQIPRGSDGCSKLPGRVSTQTLISNPHLKPSPPSLSSNPHPPPRF
jgi:hypothetical protein